MYNIGNISYKKGIFVLAKRKKFNGLSMAIGALSAVIIGIIILIIVLVYFHMKEDTGNERGETTTTAVSTPQEASGDPDVSTPESKPETEGTADTAQTAGTESTEPPVTEGGVVLPQTYNKDYFKDDLFIGDSIFTGLHLYNYLDANNVYAAVGLNPESALTHQEEGITCVQKAQTMQPRNIYIMLGTNGLAFFDTSYMAKSMLSLIEALEQACPTAKICILSIPPVTKAHDAEGAETMQKVKSYNEELRKYCTQGGYTFIDICSGLVDEEGYFSSKYAEADGLHFLGGTYQAVLGYIEQVLG